MGYSKRDVAFSQILGEGFAMRFGSCIRVRGF